MKNKFSILLVAMMVCFGVSRGADVINLTPRPAQLVRGTGELELTAGMKVGYAADLPEAMIAEVTRFVSALNVATDLGIVTEVGEGTVKVSFDGTYPAAGYVLNITNEGADVKASTTAGLFYAFQTVKKLLPANVMAGVNGGESVVYVLPVVEITDAPRYEYRG